MNEQNEILDLMRVRYMKGEPLLQPGDSFPVFAMMDAMNIVKEEARRRGLDCPIAIRQPN